MINTNQVKMDRMTSVFYEVKYNINGHEDYNTILVLKEKYDNNKCFNVHCDFARDMVSMHSIMVGVCEGTRAYELELSNHCYMTHIDKVVETLERFKKTYKFNEKEIHIIDGFIANFDLFQMAFLQSKLRWNIHKTRVISSEIEKLEKDVVKLLENIGNKKNDFILCEQDHQSLMAKSLVLQNKINQNK
jgi:hypothetical protein